MITIPNVTQAQIGNLLNALLQNHTDIKTNTANNWTITGHGIKCSASYDVSLSELTLNILSKPFFIPESLIQSQIESHLKGGS